MIFTPKPKPPNHQVYETVSFAFLPHKLKDGRTVWMEKVWKKECVEYYVGRSGQFRIDRLIDDAPAAERFPEETN